MIISSLNCKESILEIKLNEDAYFDLNKTNKSFIEKADTIKISGYFDYPINFITNKTTKLSIHLSKYKYPLDNLPSTLIYLDIYYPIKNNDLVNLPHGLNYLKVNNGGFRLYNLDNLPATLEYLELAGMNIPNINNLPYGLKYLNLEYNKIDGKIENLPDRLETINIINFKYENQLKIIIPNNLKTFKYRPAYLESIKDKYVDVDVSNKIKNDIIGILEENKFSNLKFIIDSSQIKHKEFTSLQNIYLSSGITFYQIK
jgi:hypothetical protein